MRELLEKKLFPFVIKPGRYTGGEPGQIIKDHTNRLSYLHIYPDKYEIGQSHVGSQNIYHLVNKDDRLVCERAYAVDIDASEIMTREQIPLFSLETSTPASEFDVIGFTLVDESVYTNLLHLLHLSGIPFRSKDRDNSHPLIIAGGPAAYNPEPMADYIDAFFVGDGEEGVPELLGLLYDIKDKSRSEKLETLAREIEGVYVPSLYDANHQPLQDFAPGEIKARLVSKLKPEFYPEQPVIPLIEPVHSHLAVEIMRGCPQSCRYCMASPIYRPVRLRSKEEIISQVEGQLQKTGYNEVSLMSLSTSDYPYIEDLATDLARRLEPQKVSIALPSLRPGTITPALLKAVSQIRRYGLTIAPEAGTERLRLFIRKRFPDQAIFDTVRLAFKKGWSTIKLYFMIGLPSETEEDLQGIIDICHTVRKIGKDYPGKKTINVSLSPFVPKPHTPFQWDEMVDEAAAFQKILFIKNNLRVSQINIKYENTPMAMLLGILGRGGREMGPVIEAAYNKGCVFDHWSENFEFAKWQEAFEENNIDYKKYLKAVPFSENLPWSHITKGRSRDALIKEREKTSHQLIDYQPLSFDETTDENDGNTGQTIEYGRSKKKVVSRNLNVIPKNRVRLHWGKNERFRFMSHLDNLKFLERTIRMARLPIAYSQGFNPTMKLSFGPPLPLGFTSEAEYVDLQLDSPFMNYMLDNIRKVLPEGVSILEAAPVIDKKKSLSALLNRAVYTLPLSYWNDIEVLKRNIADMLDKDRLEIERTGKETSKIIDIRPAIYDLEVDNEVLKMTLGVGEGGFARPPEIAAFLSEALNVEVPALTFHRRAVFRDENGQVIDPMEL